MEEPFELSWEDATTVVQTEEVVCDNEILPPGADEFTDIHEVSEEVIETTENEQSEVSDGSIMYLTDGNVLVMQQPSIPQESYQEDGNIAMDVSEEVIADQWGEACPEEIIVGSEEAVGDTVETTNDDCDILLPADQDEYTASRPYPCDFCSRRFRKKANLMNHMVAHQTDRPHGCNLCGVRYVRKCDLMNHLKIHATMPDGDVLEEEDMLMSEVEFRKKTPNTYVRRRKKKVKEEFEGIEDELTASSSNRAYGYSEGDMEGENSKIEYHEQYVSNIAEEEEMRYPITDPKKPFVCQHCGVGFAREKALASHARIHGGDSPFECQKCGEMFWDLGLLRDHIRNKHGDMEVYDDDEDEDYTSEQEDSQYGTFYCSTCGLSFHRQDNLRRHQRIHVKEEFVDEVEFRHICNVCGESFQEALDLLAHAEIHARGSEHRCMVCGELGPDETSIAVHVQEKHGKNLPPNTCMLCGRTCKDKRALLKHSWEHSKEKVFACSICAKTFHNKARLKRHMLSHRSKVVNCDVCGEEFPDGRSLMNHRHSHSNVSGNKFPCRECGKTFGSRSSQQIHIRIHTGERPYGCRFCWKAFADGGTLRKHERIHTGEKPYACAVCPRAFNQRVVLREHIRSHHSGPDPRYSHSMTPYCCAVCSDMFATAQDLILHLIHHCDMNTALKRQPQERPRKYKRRRKLKPHELDLISNRMETDPLVNMDEHNLGMVEQTINEERFYAESEQEQPRQKRVVRRSSKKAASPESLRQSLSESYSELYSNVQEAIDSIDPNPSKSPPTKMKGKKQKTDSSMPSRPKMIHTQKTRVPVDSGEDGRIRHRTRTLVTRTQPTELKSLTGERIRPRTKNVSYHVLNPEKLPLATFSDDTQEAVNNLLRQTQVEMKSEFKEESHNNGNIFDEPEIEQPPEVAAEQIVETDMPVPVGIVQVSRKSRRTSRHVIGSVRNVRMIKEGMIVSKIKKMSEGPELPPQVEPESILPDIQPMENVYIKQEYKENEATNKNAMVQEVITMKQEVVDPSPLHELAEISMHHANSHSLFKCEMCSEVFTDRAQLLVHVPIHI